MPGYITAAVKATSTVCLLWSAYLIARSRVHRKRSVSSVSEFDETSVIDSKRPDPFNACSVDLDGTLNIRPCCANADDRPHGVNSATKMFSLLHRSWSAVARLLYDASESSQLKPPKEPSPNELYFYIEYVTDLARKTNLISDQSFRRKVGRFYSPARSYEMLTEDLLRRLVAYTKSDEFLNALLRDSNFPCLLEFLIRLALSSCRSCTQAQEKNLDVSSEQSPLPERAVPNLPQHYPICISVASILANASRNPWCTRELLHSVRHDFENLLDIWCHSPSLQLLLLGSKIRFNLAATQAHISKTDCTEPTTFDPVYYPDIYRLDRFGQSCLSDQVQDKYDFDVIFVHGMWGSVFYTWRQSEYSNKAENSTSSTCWPRDWLSSQFPRARILGIDTSLSPFIWNSVCPTDRFRRTLDSRARSLLPQLKAAGVGRRPIIWVTHSAGGILVKEVLRLSKNGDMNPSEKPSPPDISRSALDIRYNPTNSFSHNALTAPNPVMSSSDDQSSIHNPKRRKWTDRLSVPADAQSFCQCTDDYLDNPNLTVLEINRLSGKLQNRSGTVGGNLQQSKSAKMQAACNSSLADRTRGVVFMSVPHRGNQSLCAMYWWPLRWALTPEAIQLERDSPYLLDLHSWFSLWAVRKNVHVLTMAEQRVTPVNRHCSILLVPEDIRDREMGEVVRIDSDHMYISKPHSPEDPTYINIVNFIHQTLQDSEIKPIHIAAAGQCSSSGHGGSSSPQL